MYYLTHYFNPDFDRLHLKPSDTGTVATGSDLYNLGYAQNVLAGQKLAELIPIDELGPEHDIRFCRDQPILPVGFNTCVDPTNPLVLLAKASGHVYYLNDRITVKTLLNVPQDVDFNTGNIFFVGDVAVHGSVRAGFAVHGNNVRVMGIVEGADVRAHGHLLIDGGVWGGVGEKGLVHAGGNLKCNFLEKAEARACGNMLLNQNCLFSTVYAGSSLAVNGKVYGGEIHATGSILANTQLGNRAEIPTTIQLGYDPVTTLHLKRIDKLVVEQAQTIRHLTAVAGHLPVDTNETTRRLAYLKMEQQRHLEERSVLLKKMLEDEKLIARCRLVCQGRVYPGVEISIGRVYMKVERQYIKSMFYLGDGQIIAEPVPTTVKVA
ncbi:MAG: DUF342 domain-containing protein [Desulfovibrio sp.]|nr:DUF342 domain-containing protein [Desulfovibrio sp.]